MEEALNVTGAISPSRYLHYIFLSDHGLALRAIYLKPKPGAQRRALQRARAPFGRETSESILPSASVTALPWAFSCGTNWDALFQGGGGVIGPELAMDGRCLHFSEVDFRTIIFGEKRLGRIGIGGRRFWLAGLWLRAYYRGHKCRRCNIRLDIEVTRTGKIDWPLLVAVVNKRFLQYRTMLGAVQTGLLSHGWSARFID